jgi:hypothetical protein
MKKQADKEIETLAKEVDKIAKILEGKIVKQFIDDVEKQNKCSFGIHLNFKEWEALKQHYGVQ